ncbi:DUF4240 domain-containing protein [Kitasatospora sp. NBC_00240]|uniref:DUF4240 domain-containing protein n=1 Tax=Kitasatospora sp. NBC_00240 TaxID=2903567 RepID=UPI002253BDB2|nr:DUF4240 domain-containing protein [Kitasatospora sp. NBC_00240]MCX5209544.1 DUF4240 domain-containing protein [Kitasatospora sp. NBC_00240]
MDTDTFWRLIGDARARVYDEEQQVENLTDLLAALPPAEIIAFARLYSEYHGRAYTWRLWAAGYVINGGCSDDGFDYFRDWLIARGRACYERALADPDGLADLSWDGNRIAEAESFGYAAHEAYERVTGTELPYPEVTAGTGGTGPAGEPWEEEDLAYLLPRLSARFG